MAFKESVFEVIGFINQRFSIVATVKNKNDSFTWQMLVVYGSAYLEYKLDFIDELHDTLNVATYPVMICGDFNLVRNDAEKSRGKLTTRLPSYLMIGSIDGP